LPSDAEIASLSEGGTPFIRLNGSRELLGVDVIYAKFERGKGANATGSFKDRGMTVAISMAKYLGFNIVACASTGNTAASMATYARRAGIKPLVILPEGRVAKGKLDTSNSSCSRNTLMVEGDLDEALNIIVEASRKGIIYLLNFINL